MSQASFLSPEIVNRVQVLAPYPLSRAYDYALPKDLTIKAGDYVRIPFGRRETIAVAWGVATDTGSDDGFDPKKLKYVLQKYDVPAMCPTQMEFVGWVARYTMSDIGSVLKMCLPVPEALEEQRGTILYTLATTAPEKITVTRKKIITVLQDGIPRQAADIAREAGCTAAVVKAMAVAGQLLMTQAEPLAPCIAPDVTAGIVDLSDAQAQAAKSLRTLTAQKEYAGVLLDGVTGSGKTEVYFEAVAEALNQGRQALILLPEIGLSTQFVERFERRFGTAPALWHSEVTPAQKKLVWRGVAEGKTKVVIGARSALFLPFVDLGTIIVDEEHDASYKQEEGVLYNARDMAVVRARLEKCPIVLVSATPTLETMTNATEGKYHYLHLPTRHAGALMPEMHLVDVRKTPPPRQRFIAPPLREALLATYEAGEQAMLFLNRRGYAPLTLCRTCGYRFQCPSCAAWLVEHKRHHHLQCHHCGHAQKMPPTCPGCQSEDGFTACGPGVERIAEEIKEILPEARTNILASDITTSALQIKNAILDIENRNVDVIVGTQIIAKGHHFPSLTLVGVIDADLGLAGGDLRAGERTFQLLHQVAGRAGRGEKPGRVFIQTAMPEQQVIRALAANDRDAFLAAESAERARAEMPPFGKLAALVIAGQDEQKLDQFCRQLAQGAPRYDDVRVLGPAPAPLAFLRGKHRRRFLVKARKDIVIQKFLSEWLSRIKVPSTIQLKTDIDPQSFF